MTQPNIVLIIADHVAYAGHYGNERYPYRWPNLEAIGNEGAWFENAYAVTPVCTPSRASLMTGKRPDKHGLRWNAEYPIPDNLKEFREGEKLYAHGLSDQGYDNYYYGKWHCGKEKLPEDYGLKGWSLPEYGNLYGSERYKAYLKDIGETQPMCRIDHHLMRPKLDGTDVLMDPVEPWDYMDGVGVLLGSPEVQEQFFIANLAIDQLEQLATQKSDKPFSLVVSLWGPHHPYYPSQFFADMINPLDIPPYPGFDETLEDKPLRYRAHRDLRCLHRAHERWAEWEIWQTVLARCYAQGLQTDAAIGRINDTLKRLGLADDTLLIVTADHGDGAASHGGVWDKYSTFTEEVAKVPLVMRYPKSIKPETRVSDYVNLMDISDTLLDVAGIDKSAPIRKNMDGESLIDFCNDKANRQSMILDHYGHSGDVSYQKICYDGDWKYVACYGDGDELYNLKDDPHELKNLIDDIAYDTVKHHMRHMIIDHMLNRREMRKSIRPPEFLEKGIVFSSALWPREETLLLFKLQTIEGLKT
jgi:arylsulfatase A-like enzyme